MKALKETQVVQAIIGTVGGDEFHIWADNAAREVLLGLHEHVGTRGVLVLENAERMRIINMDTVTVATVQIREGLMQNGLPFTVGRYISG